VEAINKAWSVDIEESSEPAADSSSPSSTSTSGAVSSFEEQIRDPRLDALQATSPETAGSKLEISSLESQAFLATQLDVLDKIRAGNETSGIDSRPGRGVSQVDSGDETPGEEGRVNEHIGPVQFNMGGIQVDADDMLQRLKLETPSLPLHQAPLTSKYRTAKHTKPPNQRPPVSPPQEMENPKTKHSPPSSQAS
jgi:dynein light intermediate chain 1, cytosolic